MRLGKRRPFIIGGAIATIMSLMLLAWAREIVGGFLGLFGADPESAGVKNSILIFAVAFIYVLDFAINVSKYLTFRQSLPRRSNHAQSKPAFELSWSTARQHINKNPPTPG
jgi:hypothetical protein